MKRLLFILALASHTLLMLADSSTSGRCGSDIKWKFNDRHGELTLRGSGFMDNYSEQHRAPWYHLRDRITTIDIGRGITSVGDYAFDGCEALQTVVMDADRSDMAVIGNSAFQDCRQLAVFNIPARTTSIGQAAFRRSGLTAFAVPAYVSDINVSAFEACEQLTSVRMSNVQHIRADAFRGCQRLNDVTFSVTLKSIGANAFASCTSLTNLQLPTMLTEIGEAAFANNTLLQSLLIPASVERIGASLVADCTNLSQLSFDAACRVTHLSEKCCFNARNLSVLNLPDAMTHIDASALANTMSLKQLTLPQSLMQIGRQAFEGSGITDLMMPATMRYLAPRCLYKCQNLRSLTIAALAQIDTIPAEMCALSSALETVQLNEGVTHIETHAFDECYALKTINLPSTLCYIGEQAFFHTALRSVSVPATVRYMGQRVFASCKKMRTLDFAPNAQLRDVPAEMCSGNESLRGVRLPIGLNSIGRRAFYHTYKLTSVNLPESLTVIEQQAFCESGIRHINVGSNMRNMSYDAFEACADVDSLTWNSSMLDMSRYDMPVYSLRHQIKTLVIGNAVLRVTRGMCAPFDSLRSICLRNPSVMLSIGAFKGNQRLHDITYPVYSPGISADLVHLYIMQRPYATLQTDSTITLQLWPTGALTYYDLRGPVKHVRVTSDGEPHFLCDKSVADFDRNGRLTRYNDRDVIGDRLVLDTITYYLSYDTINRLTSIHGSMPYTETVSYDEHQRMGGLSASDNYTDIARAEYYYDAADHVQSRSAHIRYYEGGHMAFRTENTLYQIISTDERGNWTARKDDRGAIETREIEYYTP